MPARRHAPGAGLWKVRGGEAGAMGAEKKEQSGQAVGDGGPRPRNRLGVWVEAVSRDKCVQCGTGRGEAHTQLQVVVSAATVAGVGAGR